MKKIKLKNDAVLVIIRNDENKILFLDRNFKPFGWGLPGGKIDDGEIITDCLHREIREEIGREITGYTFKKSDEAIDGRMVHIFEGKIDDEENIKLSLEHKDFKWIGEKELKNYTFAGNTLNFLQ